MRRKGFRRIFPAFLSLGVVAKGCNWHLTLPRSSLQSVQLSGLVFLLPALSFPTMIFAIPPLVVLIPAVLSFGVEIAPPGVSLGAVLPVIVNRVVEVRFGSLDCVLAFCSVIRVSGARGRKKQQQRRSQDCAHECM